MVVCSSGLDEISTMGPTKIIELRDGKITEKELRFQISAYLLPGSMSLKAAMQKQMRKLLERLLPAKTDGKRRDIVLLNAAAAIIIANLVDDFASAIKIAAESIDNGKAETCLEKLIKISNAKGIKEP